MFRHQAAIHKRLAKRRLERFKRRETVDNIITGMDVVESEDESTSSENDLKAAQPAVVNSLASSLPCPDESPDQDYHEDYFDNPSLPSADSPGCMNSPPLFDGSHVSTYEAVHRLVSFALDSKMNKYCVLRLLRLLKQLLPDRNKLPRTWKSAMKVIGYVSSSRKSFLCFRCFQRCVKCPNGERKCGNEACNLHQRILRTSDAVEVVHMDIRSQVQNILIRNHELLNRNDLFPASDVCFGETYRRIDGVAVNRVTLIVHTDGAPLIKVSKQNLWPCFASLVELPPPVREYQQNIVVLALWSSKVKPDPNVFLNETIEELKYLIEHGTSIFIHGEEYQINLRTQCFVSDLPAKALFCRTIHFNGYFACTECYSAGQWSKEHSMVLYPYNQNNLTTRTHDGYVKAANQAQLKSQNGKDVSVDGVKGYSNLFQIFDYPHQIVFDYMHLVCINHVPALIKRWCSQITKATINSIDQCLAHLRFPHNLKVIYLESISNVGQWKARSNRVFVLNVGVPIALLHLPVLLASHFLLYSMAIKMLHAPESSEEIDLAEQIINFYCESAPFVFDKSIELFSLHAHIHLPGQVRRHGGLVHTSTFCFESCIRFVEQKAHGSKHLASQIAYWTDFQSLLKTQSFHIPPPTAVNVMDWQDPRLAPYQSILSEQLSRFNFQLPTCEFYLRFKTSFITFHTSIYDAPFKCRSYCISFVDPNVGSTHYGDVVVFVRRTTSFYALVRKYIRGSKSTTDYVDIPRSLHQKANELFPLMKITDDHLLIPVEAIRHKCVSVPIDDMCCLTEIRVDYEHD